MARYAVIKNNGASAVNLVDSNLPTFAVNNDPKGFGAGIRHTF